MITKNKGLQNTVEDVELFTTRGPWETKSKGNLRVLFSFPYEEVLRYFSYDDKEVAPVQQDIRGLRAYTVEDLQKGVTGGIEFHKIRKEILIVLQGSVTLHLRDTSEATKEFLLSAHDGVYIPPYIVHTYTVEEDDTKLLAIANTLFDTEDKSTHDTFSLEEFQELS